MIYQQTLQRPFTLKGMGIHLGKWAEVTVFPASADSGRVFQIGSAVLPAHADFVVDTTRCTTLGIDGVRISTVEHLLSALYACGIDNAHIAVEGEELPILDGSALPFVQAIQEAGIEVLPEPARFLTLQEPLTFPQRASLLEAVPAAELEISVDVDFADWPEGAASARWMGSDTPADQYARFIAPARTFAFQKEVEALLAAGLAQGGSLENALIIQPPDVFSSALRLPQEWCVHKLLDLIGDLALVGRRLKMAVRASRPGHRINALFAQELLKLYPDPKK